MSFERANKWLRLFRFIAIQMTHSYWNTCVWEYCRVNKTECSFSFVLINNTLTCVYASHFDILERDVAQALHLLELLHFFTFLSFDFFLKMSHIDSFIDVAAVDCILYYRSNNFNYMFRNRIRTFLLWVECFETIFKSDTFYTPINIKFYIKSVLFVLFDLL